jgi:glycosyltransferase involved in cell wall biosynthesis
MTGTAQARALDEQLVILARTAARERHGRSAARASPAMRSSAPVPASADRPIRVHALIDTLGVGGAETVLAEFAAVAPLGGIELSVGYLQDDDDGDAATTARRLRQAGVEPRLAGIPGHLGPAAFLAVRRQLADLRPQLVHTHLGYADLLGGPAARSLGIPSVATVHAHAWPGDARERVKHGAMRLARRASATRLLAVSDSAREAYLASGGMRPERVVVVRNGIAGTPQPGTGRAVRAELGIGEDELVVAMISWLRPEKAHDVALAAVAELLASIPQLRLVVVGDGPLRGEVDRAASALGDRALVTGYRPDVMALLDAADVLLHPSRHDALPTTVIEALAASTPVVATRVGGIPEIVDDGVTGVLVPAPPSASELAAALGALLRDPPRRRRLAAAGLARFEQEFTAARWAARMGELYRSVLSSRG